MTIGFDAKRAYTNASGLGSYSRTLIKSVSQYYPANQFDLYTPKLGDNKFEEYVDSHDNMHTIQPQSFVDTKLKFKWRSYEITHLLNKSNADVYHGLSNELPVNIKQFKGKKVVTIHDLIFLRYPKLYPFIDAKIYNKKFKDACINADIIIAISEETKKDIIHYYGIAPDKIQVVYQSCNELFYQDIADETINRVKSKYKLPENYLFYVGTIEERKNLLTLVKSLTRVKDIPLVVAGRKTAYFEKVASYLKENGLENRVLFLDSVHSDDLPSLYHLANLFVLPSILEGFGIPIIEALTCKTPVITSQGGCFPETGGEGSIYINPLDVNELSEKINFVLNSSQEQERMIIAGVNHAQTFHPKKITNQLLKIYQS